MQVAAREGYILCITVIQPNLVKIRTKFFDVVNCYFISEQLFGPTGSLKQLDIAMTAASIDSSSPCLSHQIDHMR